MNRECKHGRWLIDAINYSTRQQRHGNKCLRCLLIKQIITVHSQTSNYEGCTPLIVWLISSRPLMRTRTQVKPRVVRRGSNFTGAVTKPAFTDTLAAVCVLSVNHGLRLFSESHRLAFHGHDLCEHVCWHSASNASRGRLKETEGDCCCLASGRRRSPVAVRQAGYTLSIVSSLFPSVSFACLCSRVCF